MRQTEEHLQILIYFGVQRIVVALTKTDLVKSAESAEIDLRAQLAESPFAEAPIVKTSAATGLGLDELRTQLAREFSTLEPQRDLGKPRLFVDRAFSLRGVGTVATGTLSGGKFSRGDSVILQPANLPARIRSLQTHNQQLQEIVPGTRAALNLPDLSIARRSSDRGVGRGDVITLPELGNATSIVDLVLARSPRLPSSAPQLRYGAYAHIHHGSGSVAARVFFKDGRSLGAGRSVLAELRLEAPIVAFLGDRIVVRDASAQHTLAGGIILDADATAKRFRTSAQKRFLEQRAAIALNLPTLIETQLARDHFANTSAFLQKSHFSAAEVSAALRSLAAAGKIFLRDDFAADANWWKNAREIAFAAIDAEHKAYPHQVGLDLARLRHLFAKESGPMFDALVADLSRQGAARVGDAIKRQEHQPALPSQMQMAGANLRRLLANKPFDPPARKELAPDAPSRQALQFLCETGEAIEIAQEVVLAKSAFEKMRDAVVEFIRRRGPATVGELRQSIGSSRRVMVPFLERLDREGVTRRVEDKRILPR
ncbi:MAG TPA: SelB C-terminal domain-containing protein, partial [Chthoniobacterales bacterium]